MLKRFLIRFGWVPLVLAVVGLTGCSPKPPPDAIFLVVVDTLRPDRLSCYGYDQYATPHIDALAAAGVRFDNAQSVASWTVPSMGAMMTSQYPTRMALIEKPARGQQFEWRARRQQVSYQVPDDEVTLAEILRDAGYQTVAFVNQPFLDPRNGFLQGFDDACRPTKGNRIEWIDPATDPRNNIDANPNAIVYDRLLIDEFAGWVKKHAGDKMFVWIHLLTPHRPYDPPMQYRPALTGRDYTPSMRYDGEIQALDVMIGGITAAIDTYVGRDRSLVVFTSDHGEEFGEHGREEHGHSMHREVIRVPLLVVAPNAPSGRTVTGFVRTIDIMPTILQLSGVGGIPQDAKGQSLVPMLAGREPHAPVYSEGVLYGYTKRSFIDDRAKVIFDAETGGFALYDLITDPLEYHDISVDEPERLERLRSEMFEFHKALAEEFARRIDPNAVSEETEEQLKALRALGYLK